jgi:hypothetical protein
MCKMKNVITMGCIIIFYRTYMVVRSQELFRDMSYARNFELNLETKVG